jgi:hypothetical protein
MSLHETALTGGIELLAGILLVLWGVELATGRLGLRDRIAAATRRWYGRERPAGGAVPRGRRWLAGALAVALGLLLVALGCRALSALM